MSPVQELVIAVIEMRRLQRAQHENHFWEEYCKIHAAAKAAEKRVDAMLSPEPEQGESLPGMG